MFHRVEKLTLILSYEINLSRTDFEKLVCVLEDWDKAKDSSNAIRHFLQVYVS